MEAHAKKQQSTDKDKRAGKSMPTSVIRKLGGGKVGKLSVTQNGLTTLS